MVGRPPGFALTDPLLPYRTLFRSRGDGDGMGARGDSFMQIRQRLRVIERRTRGHDPGQEVEGALRLGNEGLEVVAIVEAALLRGDLKKRALGPAHLVRRR